MELGIEIETFNWGLRLRIITQEFEWDQGRVGMGVWDQREGIKKWNQGLGWELEF